MYNTGFPAIAKNTTAAKASAIAYVTLLSIFLLVSGCSSRQYIVVDQSGMTFHLEKATLKNGTELEILDGEAVRKVHLKDIRQIIIDLNTTHYKDNKLYYYAKVKLEDGTEIKPIKTEDGSTKSFVSIHNVMIGQSKTGKVIIPFENINVISKNYLEEE